MLIKEAKYKNVKVVQKRCISEAVYGCDECRKEIKEYPNEENRLEIKVFYKEGETKYFHFCSWSCVLKHLPKLKTDYFIDLPFIYSDQGTRNQQELLDALANYVPQQEESEGIAAIGIPEGPKKKRKK